ncbi:MAG: bifunctional glutamate N-acetyltransferase/amino-acid acetyltransferase ArgJ [Nitrospiraceae bacterium]
MARQRTGITAPNGFTAAGIASGIKKKAGVLDLALVHSERPGPIAGVFTKNQVVAAPVTIDRAHLRKGLAQVMLINSGCANVCTGPAGMEAAKQMVRLAAEHFQIPAHTVFIGSTGVIGGPLPIERIVEGFPKLAARLRAAGGNEAARAIMTTDTCSKETVRRARIGGRLVTIGGMAKGSGMIHPNMATMLGYLTTDAVLPQRLLQRALVKAVDQTFNCISVDGDTSTNDTVLCLANGEAGHQPLTADSANLRAFERLLLEACEDLALQVGRDGEGLTKFVKIHVRGARRVSDAKRIAETIGTSCLVKTALFGEDANWGRIMAAIGRAGVTIRPERMSLSFSGVPIMRDGATLGAAAEQRIAKVFRRKEFTIEVELGLGEAEAHMWTTDLSYEYVRINASYRS